MVGIADRDDQWRVDRDGDEQEPLLMLGDGLSVKEGPTGPALVVIWFVAWGIVEQGLGHVKNALSLKHLDHRLDSSDDVMWMWKRRTS
ncbi:hypothetical protein NL676_007197 [Syzygium grande]|nr:hypothetical protein NL676_007197 [Syzygium grande]